MKWITRAHPKVDRIACPWLIRRYVDPSAEFVFVPRQDVLRIAESLHAIPFDVEGADLSHHGDHCSFDAIIEKYDLRDPALAELARIVRGADTGRLDLAPEAAGLLAISLGYAQMFDDDHQQLQQGLLIYDALYSWLTEARYERHPWRSGSSPSTGTPGAVDASSTRSPAS